MLQMIGFFMMCFAGMMLGSENLIIPTVVAAIGFVLLKIGQRLEDNDETA